MIIVLEGLPGVGKTTIATRLASELGVIIVPQRTELFFHQLTLSESTLDMEELYLLNDEEKCRTAKLLELKNPHTIVVMDRNYLATLAFNYAASAFGGSSSRFKRILSWYKKNKGLKLASPNIYIYLVASPKKSLALKGRTAKKDEPWSNLKYLALMKSYYEYFFSNVEPESNVIRIAASLDRNKTYFKIKQVIEKNL